MSKKPISQKKAERQRQENLTLHKVFNTFLLGLLAECYLFIVYRGYVSGSVSSMLTWNQVLRWGGYVGLVMLLVGTALAILKRETPLCKPMIWVAAAGAFLAVSGWVMCNVYPDGVTVMCVLVPVVTLLGLVFFLFQRECFLGTLTLVGTFFAVWVCANGLDSTIWRTRVIVGAVVGLLILAAEALLVRKAQQADGKLKGLRLFASGCDYRILYGVIGLCFLCVVVSLLLVSAGYYLLWVLGIALFAVLVYYTTKLM